MASSPLLELPPEIRHQILSDAINNWPPDTPPDLFKRRDQVRLHKNYSIWVPPSPPTPAFLPLLLTCRLFHLEATQLLTSGRADPTYEVDIVFVPGCGLFVTWICCPLPRHSHHLGTLRASFRIANPEELDDHDRRGRSLSTTDTFFSTRFGSPDFHFATLTISRDPSPGARTLYRLLTSFFAHGPRGWFSSALQKMRNRSSGQSPSPPCRYTIRRLLICTRTKPESDYDRDKAGEPPKPGPWGDNCCGPEGDHRLPHGPLSGEFMFGGPERGDPRYGAYAWNGTATVWDAGRVKNPMGADNLGLYLANATWALVDFGKLSRGFGLVLYEGVLEGIEFWVDGERRPRYGMGELLGGLVPEEVDCEEGHREVLARWREWVLRWRERAREGTVLEEIKERPETLVLRDGEPVERPDLDYPCRCYVSLKFRIGWNLEGNRITYDAGSFYYRSDSE